MQARPAVARGDNAEQPTGLFRRRPRSAEASRGDSSYSSGSLYGTPDSTSSSIGNTAPYSDARAAAAAAAALREAAPTGTHSSYDVSSYARSGSLSSAAAAAAAATAASASGPYARVWGKRVRAGGAGAPINSATQQQMRPAVATLGSSGGSAATDQQPHFSSATSTAAQAVADASSTDSSTENAPAAVGAAASTQATAW
jgi:hypothetical protein